MSRLMRETSSVTTTSTFFVFTAAITGASQTAPLHRIEPAFVREEVEGAGFVLEAESTVLANEADAHALKVFDASIKEATDRFAYRFAKR